MIVDMWMTAAEGGIDIDRIRDLIRPSCTGFRATANACSAPPVFDRDCFDSSTKWNRMGRNQRRASHHDNQGP